MRYSFLFAAVFAAYASCGGRCLTEDGSSGLLTRYQPGVRAIEWRATVRRVPSSDSGRTESDLRSFFQFYHTYSTGEVRPRAFYRRTGTADWTEAEPLTSYTRIEDAMRDCPALSCTRQWDLRVEIEYYGVNEQNIETRILADYSSRAPCEHGAYFELNLELLGFEDSDAGVQPDLGASRVDAGAGASVRDARAD